MQRFLLPEVMDRKGAFETAQQLLTLRGQALEVDAGQVRRLSALGAEMLLSAMQQWREDAMSFNVRHWSEPASTALQTIGLAEEAFLCSSSGCEGRAP